MTNVHNIFNQSRCTCWR